jgi:uncharacterized protein YndB with AHSA1/START domain
MEISQHIILCCKPENALVAFMNTKHTSQWWNDGAAFFDLPAKTFSWHWRATDGSFLYITHGHILSFIPGVCLQLHNMWQYDYQQPEPAGPLSLLIECTPQVNDTLLVIRHNGFEPNTPAGLAHARAVEEGWHKVLPQLKNYLEVTSR